MTSQPGEQCKKIMTEYPLDDFNESFDVDSDDDPNWAPGKILNLQIFHTGMLYSCFFFRRELDQNIP